MQNIVLRAERKLVQRIDSHQSRYAQSTAIAPSESDNHDFLVQDERCQAGAFSAVWPIGGGVSIDAELQG